MYGRIICTTVSYISLTDSDILILLIAARRLILNGRRTTADFNPEEDVFIKVSVGSEYTSFLGLRSRPFEAVVSRGGVSGFVSYLVDEAYLRSVSLPKLQEDHHREYARQSGLNVIVPESANDN